MMPIKNKNGGMFDLFIAIALSLVLITVAVVMTWAGHKTEDTLLDLAPKLQDDVPDLNVTNLVRGTIGQVNVSYQAFKWITVMLIFGYFMSILITSFLIRSHPIAFVGYIFIVLIAVVVSVYVSNTYEQLYQTPILADTWFQFTGANFIFLNLPVWITVIGFLAGALMYINLDPGGYSY